MANKHGVVRDTVTDLFLTSYSTVLENCSWGNAVDAIEFEDVPAAETVANNLNGQQSQQDRFIGQNPPPR